MILKFDLINGKNYYEYEFKKIQDIQDVLKLSVQFNKFNYEDRIDYVFYIQDNKSCLRITKDMFNDINIKEILFMYFV